MPPPSSLPSTSFLECLDIVFAHAPQAGFGVNLGSGDVLVAQELLNLLKRHSFVEQQGGPRAVAVMTVAFKEVAHFTSTHVGP